MSELQPKSRDNTTASTVGPADIISVKKIIKSAGFVDTDVPYLYHEEDVKYRLELLTKHYKNEITDVADASKLFEEIDAYLAKFSVPAPDLDEEYLEDLGASFELLFGVQNGDDIGKKAVRTVRKGFAVSVALHYNNSTSAEDSVTDI